MKMEKRHIEYRRINEITPYNRNPRKNDGAVKALANSIREFGFNQPICIDRDGVIIVGHTRYKAAKKLGLKTVPCIMLDLPPEKAKAYRLADNRVGELADWDLPMLEEELEGILDLDMSLFDFGSNGEDFFEREDKGDGRQEDNEEYNAFLEKFEPKKTTDDCYTPDNIYQAVADWVEHKYGRKKETFVRPFYPGGDYQAYKYPADCVVVDNPPFSILTEIVKWYTERNIDFFLFAPALTMAGMSRLCCIITSSTSVIYENGAQVNTGFVTSLDKALIKTEPELYQIIKEENTKNNPAKELPKYQYPANVLMVKMLDLLNKSGIAYEVGRDEAVFVRYLDSQKEYDKALFGGGFLISDCKAAEKIAAEKIAAEKIAAEKIAAEKIAAEKSFTWTLSDRERAIVDRLNRKQGNDGREADNKE